METTTEKIERLRQELADLEAQERAEKEEAQKKADAERDADLLAIMNSVKAFNEKYEENVLLLTQKDTKNLTLNDLFFPWL